MAGRIFVNYRRGDSQAAAGRLFDRLTQHFARDDIFMDVAGIEPGVDFVKELDRQVAGCGVFLTVIGPDWADARNAQGTRRLDDPHDYVRVEIESALNREIRVIPVLVDGARMPHAEELPDSIRPLARRNAVEITHHRFGGDVDDLARVVRYALGMEMPAPETQRSDPANNSWANFLFSFDGRISRKQYFWGTIALALFQALIVNGIMYIMMIGQAGSYEAAAEQISSAKFPPAVKWVVTLAGLPFLWPMYALLMKRLHDFGQGWGLFTPILILGLGANALFLAGYDEATYYALAGSLAIGFLILLIKGTTGPNEYGPDPLAKKGTATAKEVPAT